MYSPPFSVALQDAVHTSGNHVFVPKKNRKLGLKFLVSLPAEYAGKGQLHTGILQENISRFGAKPGGSMYQREAAAFYLLPDFTMKCILLATATGDGIILCSVL